MVEHGVSIGNGKSVSTRRTDPRSQFMICGFHGRQIFGLRDYLHGPAHVFPRAGRDE